METFAPSLRHPFALCAAAMPVRHRPAVGAIIVASISHSLLKEDVV